MTFFPGLDERKKCQSHVVYSKKIDVQSYLTIFLRRPFKWKGSSRDFRIVYYRPKSYMIEELSI